VYVGLYSRGFAAELVDGECCVLMWTYDGEWKLFETSVSVKRSVSGRMDGIYGPGSSSAKEGLRARIEGLERIEAEDEGLEGIRGIESESEVECIPGQSNR